MPFEERKAIIEGLSSVNSVIHFDDDEEGEVPPMHYLKLRICNPNHEIVFANGGDRNKGNIPEMSVDGIEFLFSVGRG